MDRGGKREPRESQQTLNAQVLAELRSDILTCRLKPNERLRLEALRARYQTGGSPIREALMRLEAEGFVQLEQNKGFRVSTVSPDQLHDLMRTRADIEVLALRRAIENGGVDWEADIISAFHRLSRRPKSDPDNPAQIDETWRELHKAFHSALVAACNSPTLLSIRENLFNRCERYVALSVAARAVPRDDVAEHEAILKATLARDADQAEELVRTHIQLTAEKVVMSAWIDEAGAIAPDLERLARR